MSTPFAKSPLEVRLPVLLVGASALVFFGLALIRLSDDSQALRFPIVHAVLTAIAIAVLLTGVRYARRVALVLVFLLCVVHTSIALGDLPWWVRLASGVLAAAHGYSFVLLMTKPAREFLDGVAPRV